jgi:hypothetical protein
LSSLIKVPVADIRDQRSSRGAPLVGGLTLLQLNDVLEDLDPLRRSLYLLEYLCLAKTGSDP